MKILVVGGTGTIGSAVVNELQERHVVIVAGHSQGDVMVDMSSLESIHSMYKQVGEVDAVVSAAGRVTFYDFSEMDEEKYRVGIDNKLMGQVNLVLAGQAYINDAGSFTLTSGILNHDPIRYGSSAAMVNGAIDGFVASVALELPRGLRINVVSPTVIKESMEGFAPYFRGYKPVLAEEAALAYSKSVEGLQTGQVFKAGY
jgi:NAD(P)-dependent dehydrogenase (short-subunit alcohol dehydrogenase family)